MSESVENQLKVLVVDEDTAFLDSAKVVFEGSALVVSTIEAAASATRADRLDLVVLGPAFAHENGLAGVSDIFEEDPNVPVVLVASAITAPLLKAALRAGLSDVIEAPLDETKAVEALTSFKRAPETSVAAPIETLAPETSEPGTVVAVCSAKGGSGKTVTATNLGVLLAQQYGPDKVVIVDADLQFGDVCLVLQLEPKFTVVNAAQELHRLDDSLLLSLLAKHPSGASVLAAPLEPTFADEISTKVVIEIINRLRDIFEYVIVDTASLLDELLLSLLERADKVLIIVDMDLPSVKNAKLVLETLRLLKFPSSKLQVVLNRSNAKARLDEQEIERSLKMKISASVPSDGLVPASVNEGRPVVESQPRAKVSKGFEAVASLITGVTADPSSKSSRKRRR